MISTRLSEFDIKILVRVAKFNFRETKSASGVKLWELYKLGKKDIDCIKYSMSDAILASKICDEIGVDRNGITTNAKGVGDMSRSELAKSRVYEKKNGVSVFSEFICVKKLSGNVSINGITIETPLLSHISIKPGSIFEVKAGAILIVENLETFVNQIQNMKCAQLPTDVLVVFRGSPQFGGNAERAAKALSEEYEIPIYGFYDYDISGLIKSKEQNLDGYLLPNTDSLVDSGVVGNGADYQKQQKELFLKYSKRDSSWIEPHLDVFEKINGSLVQERICELGIELVIIRDL